MKISILTEPEIALFGATHRFEITYEDLSSTAATTKTLTLLSDMAVGDVISNVRYRLKTAFDGTSTTALGMEIGYDLTSGTDDANGLMESHELHNDATEVLAGPTPVADVDTSTVDDTYGNPENLVVTSLRTKLNTLLRRGPRAFSDTGSVTALFTATTANLTDLSSGEVHVFLHRARLANSSSSNS